MHIIFWFLYIANQWDITQHLASSLMKHRCALSLEPWYATKMGSMVCGSLSAEVCIAQVHQVPAIVSVGKSAYLLEPQISDS